MVLGFSLDSPQFRLMTPIARSSLAATTVAWVAINGVSSRGISAIFAFSAMIYAMMVVSLTKLRHRGYVASLTSQIPPPSCPRGSTYELNLLWRDGVILDDERKSFDGVCGAGGMCVRVFVLPFWLNGSPLHARAFVALLVRAWISPVISVM